MKRPRKALELPPERLRQVCDPAHLDFDTTADLADLDAALGQARAMEALEFGVGIRHEGFNLYVLGSTGLGKHTAVRRVLERRAAVAPVPEDWCYVNNFEQRHRPRALRLPPGRAAGLRRDMRGLVEDLLSAIPAAFQSDEYRTRSQEINESLKEREEKAFSELSERARKENIGLLRTPAGYTLAPIREDGLIGPEEFAKLADDEREDIEKRVDALKEQLKETVRYIPAWQQETREQLRHLNREVSQLTVDQAIGALREHYEDLPDVLAYLEGVESDVIDNVDAFRGGGDDDEKAQQPSADAPEFGRYRVNVLVDHGRSEGAPVVYEDNPTYQNLVGRVEHMAHLGTLLTDFTLIKPGALHQANGGYLILDARRVLLNGFAYEGLKRVLRAREVRIESLEQVLSLATTTSLEPEPVPVDLKVVLTGDRLLYYLLKEYDPEFGILFKVAADFAEDISRAPESTSLYARLVATLQRRDGLRPLERDAVARVIEQCARQAEDGEKISLHLGSLSDLLRESDYWAGRGGADAVAAEHVQRAVESRIRRMDQYRERSHEAILRDIYLVDTDGEQVAQVNGLSVMQLGDYAFGHPTRITATARLGEGEVVDIEREVELGGAIHSKGVLILSSFLASRYASDFPLSLHASIVFEQSYGEVEGDSASVAELCATLSAIGGMPLSQSLAVTGSVNQHGQVQAVGGVNDKIESFFDICRARGLSGRQGVVIPRANAPHLMLRGDLVEACRAGRFHVYAVSRVDEAMELLTGLPAGVPDGEGAFPPGTTNRRVHDRLVELGRLRQHYAERLREGHPDDEAGA